MKTIRYTCTPDGSNPHPPRTLMPDQLPSDLDDLFIHTNQNLALGTERLPLNVASAILEQWIPMMDASSDADLAAISTNAKSLKEMIDRGDIVPATFNALLDTMHAQLLEYVATMTEEGDDDAPENAPPPTGGGTAMRPKRYRKHMSRMAYMLVFMRIG